MASDADQPADPYSRSAASFRDPPRGIAATLRRLGPGMILAGSIVGSGELIMTTKLGAVAGFVFLWFVLLSCFLKVVVQAEIARHTISSGETFLQVFNTLPGPAARRPVWLSLTWMAIVVVASVVATTVFVSLPAGLRTVSTAIVALLAVVGSATLAGWWLQMPKRRVLDPKPERAERPRMNWFTFLWLASTLLVFVNSGAILGAAGQTLEMAFPQLLGPGGARLWALVVALAAAALLLAGGYESLEKTLILLVASFTLVTVVCTLLLQTTDFAIRWEQLESGLTFQTPQPLTAGVALTALAMYAGTGVAYGEMWNYTYWCVEKGYARNAGEPQPGPEWAARAKGWIGVMYADVLVTMVVYTVSTICFYLLGAAILHAKGLDPKGAQTIVKLQGIFTETLGDRAALLFVVGAFFVLFSTVLSGVGGYSRLMADTLCVIGIIDARDYNARRRFIKVFICVSLGLFLVTYWLFRDPPQMLGVTSSLIAAVMYPVLGLGVLYLRHRRLDPRIAPSAGTTLWLWICGLAVAVISPLGILLTLALKFGWLRW